MKNIRIFYLKIFLFLVAKFSIYLNKRVFVMRLQEPFGFFYHSACENACFAVMRHW